MPIILLFEYGIRNLHPLGSCRTDSVVVFSVAAFISTARWNSFSCPSIDRFDFTSDTSVVEWMDTRTTVVKDRNETAREACEASRELSIPGPSVSTFERPENATQYVAFQVSWGIHSFRKLLRIRLASGDQIPTGECLCHYIENSREHHSSE